jgi:Bacterial Ig-like domain (group 3)
MRKLKKMIITNSYQLIFLPLLLSTSMEASTQATLSQLVLPAPTTTQLEQQSSGPLFVATMVPLTVQVTAANGVTISSGRVSLTDNSSVIGDAPITNGTASFNQVVLSGGAHQLIACYVGASNFLNSCSTPSNYSAVVPYVLEQGTETALISAPKVFVDKLKVVPAMNFSGIVQLTCQVSSDSCDLQPSTVSFSGDGKAQIVDVSFSPTPMTTSAGFIGVPLAGLIGLLVTKKCKRSSGIALFVCSTVFLCLAGCGPVVSIPVNVAGHTILVNSTSGPYSQAVTYQIQVATDVAQ